MTSVSISELAKNVVHIGHRSDKWNPKMKDFLWKKCNGVHIIDLNHTVEALKKVQTFLKGIALQNKKVLFVGTKPQVALEISRQLPKDKLFYINKKWTPGLLTNFKEMRKRIDYYLDLKKQFETNEINKYTKKEVSKFKKILEKLEDLFSGVAEMRQIPDVICVLDAVSDRIAIDEANVLNIPVISIADANANTDGIDIVIPGNDDSIRSVRLLLSEIIQPLLKK